MTGQEVEVLARLFHDTYERLAPTFGYATREDTRVFDPTTPNGRLMIAVCGEVAAAIEEAERERLRAALLNCARQAEALKRECGMDPDSVQAVRNAQYQAISTTAHIALGTIRGPQGAERSR